jgi:hypothetical protein
MMTKSSQGIAALALVCAAALPAWGEGVLNVGSPTVSGNNVVLPVYLEGNVDSGVAALDFTLRYDPAVLAPGGVRAGDAAVAADKGVQYNMKAPGQYVVMMFGLNQSTMESGKIADITLRRVGSANPDETSVSIDGTTLASLEGQTIASRGSSATVQLANTPTDDPDPDEPETPPDTNPDPTVPVDEGPGDDGEAEPDGPNSPGTANPRNPTLPGSDPDSDDGKVDPSRPASPRPLLSRPNADAESGLSQLNRMAREFERRRAAISSPPLGEVEANGPAVPRSAPEGNAGARAAVARPDAGVRSLAGHRNGGVGPLASLAPMNADRLHETNPAAGTLTEPDVSPSAGFFADRRVWILGAILVALVTGFVVRKRLLSQR